MIPSKASSVARSPCTGCQVTLFAALLCGLSSCTPGGSSDRTSLRDSARLVLERECGECHIPDSPTGLPSALTVYDLRELEWSNRMTDTQLEKLSARIAGGAREMFDPFDVRNAGASPPPLPTPEEVRVVQAFLRLELDTRRRPRTK